MGFVSSLFRFLRFTIFAIIQIETYFQEMKKILFVIIKEENLIFVND